jgi:hypothetical protein
MINERRKTLLSNPLLFANPPPRFECVECLSDLFWEGLLANTPKRTKGHFRFFKPPRIATCLGAKQQAIFIFPAVQFF